MIYLTADRTEPTWTTEKTIYQKLPIFWTNWYKFKEVIDEVKEHETGEIAYRIFDLLSEYLEHKKFSCFKGWPTNDVNRYIESYPDIFVYESEK